MTKFNRIMDVAYLRDGESIHTGEALLLAMLVHTKGKNRKSKEMTDLRKIMKDHNLEPRTQTKARP